MGLGARNLATNLTESPNMLLSKQKSQRQNIHFGENCFLHLFNFWCNIILFFKCHKTLVICKFMLLLILLLWRCSLLSLFGTLERLVLRLFWGYFWGKDRLNSKQYSYQRFINKKQGIRTISLLLIRTTFYVLR